MKQLFVFFILAFQLISSQNELSITGKVTSSQEALPYANVLIKESGNGVACDVDGNFIISNLSSGTYTLVASFAGYKSQERSIVLDDRSLTIHFDLQPDAFLDEVVVTGTRTFKRKTNSPVIVSIINHEALNEVQACNLSEGLRFQPGLRVETDCQTCNYTQLRMNGLAGGYSQILINGRPIFSPLTGLYGLEQIPVNMIERIETIRGGGSTLYGSSAIGGVVNVITLSLIHI